MNKSVSVVYACKAWHGMCVHLGCVCLKPKKKKENPLQDTTQTSKRETKCDTVVCLCTRNRHTGHFSILLTPNIHRVGRQKNPGLLDCAVAVRTQLINQNWATSRCSPCRAEPLLTQIKANRTVVVSPVFDRVNADDFGIAQYHPMAQAFDWALWCMYEGFSPEYYNLQDGSLPGK